MLIDWFTVGAQVLNFLILVLLLRHFLYGPILAAIAAREKLIAGKISDATAKDAEATKQRDEYQKKNEAFDTERTALLKKATDAAHTESERLLDEARKAADALSAKRAEALRSEAQQLRASISRTTQDQVFAIARKTLADLASTTLEKQAVDEFEKRFRGISADVKSGLSKALAASSEPAIVRSAFDLPPACMNILSAPTAAFSITNAATCNGIVQFTDESLNIPQAWAWDFGDGEISSDQNPTHVYANEGVYSVSLTVTNTLGEDILLQTDVVNFSTPQAPTASGASGCASEVVSLSANGGIENLLDTKYHDHLDWGGIPRPGRNFYLNLSYSF